MVHEVEKFVFPCQNRLTVICHKINRKYLIVSKQEQLSDCGFRSTPLFFCVLDGESVFFCRRMI